MFAVDDSEDLTVAPFQLDGNQLRRHFETAFDGMFFIQAEGYGGYGKGFQLPLQGRRK